MANSYLDLLLKDIGDPAKGRPLDSILARAWDVPGKLTFEAAKLRLTDLNLAALANREALPKPNWAEEYQLVQDLLQRHPAAGRSTAFYLAQAWGTRTAAAGQADVAQFDDNRLKAARQVCDSMGRAGHYVYLKGAVSGIQKYIYHQIKAEQIGEAERVSRRLRGRSFFVALLGDLLAEEIVKQLGLEQANVLFVGGGHFHLLLPKLPNLDQEIDAITWRINEQLLDYYHLQLGVLTEMDDITAESLESFGAATKAITEKLERRKQRRFQQRAEEELVLQRVFPKVQQPPGEGGGWIRRQPELIGRFIPKADFLLEISPGAPIDFWQLLEERAHNPLPNGFHFPATNSDYFLLRTEQENTFSWQALPEQIQQIIRVLPEPSESGNVQYQITRLNNTDFLPPPEVYEQLRHLPVRFAYRTFGQYAPVDAQGNVLEFGELAKLDASGQANLPYERLAAIRLDIDDLGALFASGLGQNDSLLRTSALSRELQLVFGGYINRLAETHHLYVVYSGGDDAFLIGSWLNVLQFARALYAKFKLITNQNPELNFSAGIFICNPMYPVARLAKDAGDEETEAKHFGRELDGFLPKNAVRIFGHSLSWARFEEMMQFGEDLQQITGAGGSIRRSVLQHLLRTIQVAQAATQVPVGTESAAHFQFYTQLGRLHGLLTRRGYVGHPIIQQLLQEMNDFDKFLDYLVPIQYVLYQTRKNNG